MIKEIKIKDTPNGPVISLNYEFSLVNADSIVCCNEHLRNLRTNQEIKFESFPQYNDLLKAIAKEVGIHYSASYYRQLNEKILKGEADK